MTTTEPDTIHHSVYLTIRTTEAGAYVTLTKAGRRELATLRKQYPELCDVDFFTELFEPFADANGWELVDPSTMGLTACKLGISPDPDTIYWHERYAIEDADDELKSGELFLMLAKGE